MFLMSEDNGLDNKTGKTMTQKYMDREELERRLVYALFGPAVALATRFGMSLSWMKRALETAYFQHTRQQEMSLREICELMDISISKAALLSKQLKEGFIVEQDDDEMDLTQRIEYMLCAGPLTLPRLNQVLPNERFRDIEDALDDLIEKGIVRKVERPGMYPRYALTLGREEDSWHGTIERLRRLQNTLRPIMPSIYSHFIDIQRQDRQHTHHAVRLSPGQIAQLQNRFEQTLASFFDEMEASEQEDGVEVTVTAFWHHDV